VFPWIVTIPIAFLAGTVPFGLLIARAKGVDIRTVGSGNIGATNVGRILGRPYFFLCFSLDFLKGFTPVLAAGWAAGLLNVAKSPALDAWLWVAAMLAPVLGHVLNPWLRFRGGKGVATSLGALLAVWPHLTLPAIGVFLVFLMVLAVGRFMSLASMVAGVSLPILVVLVRLLRSNHLGGEQVGGELRDLMPHLVVSCVLAVLVVWTHRANIKRLRSGTEPRVGRKAAAAPAKVL
jgi:acyl phosphate:glycerol-3-phosphate acyltransferase